MRSALREIIQETIRAFYDLCSFIKTRILIPCASAFEGFYEVWLDPIFFAFALFMVFPRWQQLLYASRDPMEGIAMIIGDMMVSSGYYIVFGLVFLAWIIGKGISRGHTIKRDKAILEAISKQGEAIKELTEEIRKDRNERKQHSNTTPKL
jgi:hypothetical protein